MTNMTDICISQRIVYIIGWGFVKGYSIIQFANPNSDYYILKSQSNLLLSYFFIYSFSSGLISFDRFTFFCYFVPQLGSSRSINLKKFKEFSSNLQNLKEYTLLFCYDSRWNFLLPLMALF